MEFVLIKHNSDQYRQMINLRLNVLLQPIGIPETYINKEKEKEDVLIGAFDNDLLVGCCILTTLNDDTVQLRQMAVLHEYQKTGLGRRIIAFAELIASEKGIKKIVMHARDNVLDFYKKCGYQISGPQFFEVGIGHHKMEKDI